MNDNERKELVNYRLGKAKATLAEVNLHIKNELWNTSINRLYYACYYAVTALLINHKITVQTHAGVRQKFGLHFIKEGLIDKNLGKFFSNIFDKRITGDYDDFIYYEKEDIVPLTFPANELIKEIEKLINKK